MKLLMLYVTIMHIKVSKFRHLKITASQTIFTVARNGASIFSSDVLAYHNSLLYT